MKVTFYIAGLKWRNVSAFKEVLHVEGLIKKIEYTERIISKPIAEGFTLLKVGGVNTSKYMSHSRLYKRI